MNSKTEHMQAASRQTILVMPGDGIGPEITAATVTVLEAAIESFELDIELIPAEIGLAALARCGITLPSAIVDDASSADGILLGPVSHNDYPPRDQGGLNPSGELRKQLDLYANIRPARTRTGVVSPIAREFDLVIVRENTEGFYADRTMHEGTGEFMPTPDVALALRKVTTKGSLRIARQAFELAGRRRGKVTTVHKANVLRVSEGLFLRCVRKVAAEFPHIEHEERLVDAMSALLVRKPESFDVVLTTNMFGDILSDEASELAGSLGLAASLNMGDSHAMAQAQHGSAPDIAGQDKANPSSLIGSAAMLFRWLAQGTKNPDLERAGTAIERALDETVAQTALRTPDLGGQSGTGDFAAHVANTVRRLAGDHCDGAR